MSRDQQVEALKASFLKGNLIIYQISAFRDPNIKYPLGKKSDPPCLLFWGVGRYLVVGKGLTMFIAYIIALS